MIDALMQRMGISIPFEWYIPFGLAIKLVVWLRLFLCLIRFVVSVNSHFSEYIWSSKIFFTKRKISPAFTSIYAHNYIYYSHFQIQRTEQRLTGKTRPHDSNCDSNSIRRPLILWQMTEIRKLRINLRLTLQEGNIILVVNNPTIRYRLSSCKSLFFLSFLIFWFFLLPTLGGGNVFYIPNKNSSNWCCHIY